MNKISVLVVDDNEIDRYILSRQLKENGIEDIFEQNDGESALSFIAQHESNVRQFGDKYPPVVIFLDINMPIIGGFDFLEKFSALREELSLESCVIMMYSSSEREEDKRRASAFSFVKDYLVKGDLTPDILKEKLAPFMAA